MEKFTEFLKRRDKEIDFESLEENKFSQMKNMLLTIERKLEEIERKIHAEIEIARKIDLLAQQNKWSSFLKLCILAIQLKDFSIIRRIQKR